MQRLILLTILLCGVFWLATIRNGTSWGDDWALFVHHAKNISQIRSYSDVGYIYNENYTTYSPKNYPPGFPLVLAPFYAISGINYTILKVPVILSFFASLFFLVPFLRKQILPLTLLIIIALLGLNPFLWSSKDFILSDFSFTMMIVFSLWLIDRYYTDQDSSNLRLIAIGLAIYFAGSIRVLGVLLIPALLIYDLFSQKRIPRKFVIVFLSFCCCFLLQLAVIGGDGSYLDMFREYENLNLHEIVLKLIFHIEYYIKYFSDFWLINHEDHSIANSARIFSKFFLLAAFAGLCIRIYRRLSPLEIFTVLFSVVVFVYPGIQGARYFIPIFPFLLLFAFEAADRIRWRYLKIACTFALLIPVLFFYFRAYQSVDWHNIPYGIHEKPAQELFDYVKSNTGNNDIFVLSKPRAFSLYTDRKAAVLHSADQPEELVDYWKSIKADYIVTGIIDGNNYFEKLAVNDSTNFTLTYSNDWFKVFKTNF